VGTDRLDSWVRAEVVNFITLNDAVASGRSIVRFDVGNAPTREFRLRTPAAWRSVEVAGTGIRRKDQGETNGEWRVELQNKVRGVCTFTVTWDQPWSLEDAGVELSGVEALGAERETGALVVNAPPRFRVEAKAATADLLKVDVRDVPDWAGRPPEPPVAVYRYLRPGFRLTLGVQRFAEAEVLQALAEDARLTTVISEDGQMMTEMSLSVRNNARQFLEVVLPEGAQVWSAFVAGQPVRPSREGGKLLLPMERSGSEETVAVELTYVGAGSFPRRRGSVSLASPGLGIPLQNARWDLYLPPDYSYGGFEGSMRFEQSPLAPAARGTSVSDVLALPDADTSASTRNYEYADYMKEEKRNKEAQDKQSADLVGNVKAQLGGQKLREANVWFNRARVAAKGKAAEDLKSLEKDLRLANASNLLEAQQQYVVANDIGGLVANGPVAQGGAQAKQPQQATQVRQVGYDADAAAQQWDKLQRAQEVTVAKAMPLRVNLPKRGQRLAFAQVLQTEVGRPMTIELTATNAAVMEIPATVAACGGGFAALWLLAALAARRRAEA
jgi:hypothetical protein